MESHNDTPPSFSECLEYFEKVLINDETSVAASEHVNLRIEGSMSALSDAQTKTPSHKKC